MAIPSNYIDKIKKEGESRPICPPADHVRVNNENFEADNLDEVLDQVAEAIDEAADGYNPPADGIPKTDLAQGVQDSLDLADSAVQDNNYVHTDNNYTDADKTKLGGLPTNPVTSISVNGGTAQTPTNGNVNLVVEAGGLTEADISVSSNQDGTVDFTFGADTYTINLNHTHENMARLVITDEVPSNPAMDTIYAQVDDADTPTEIQSLWIAGLEFVGGGGGEPDDGLPKMTKPTDGSTISLGNNTSGLGVSKVITIKAMHLDYGGSTTGLTVEVVGTGLTIDYGQLIGQSSISIAQADAHIGTSITVSYSSNSGLDDGKLLFKQGNNTLAEVTLTAEVDLPSSFVADKAWEDVEPRTLKDKTGYCVSNKLRITNGHNLEICFGFVNATGEKYGCATFTIEPSSLSTSEAIAVYTAKNNIRTFQCNFNWISCTFKASEINNCYIKDASSNTYIWKGNNVT